MQALDEDVALLKVNANILPSLSINSQQPQASENLRIYGDIPAFYRITVFHKLIHQLHHPHRR